MRKLLTGMVSVCLLASQIQASFIEANADAFTLLSEQRLITGKGVEVHGLVGATDEVRFGKGTFIDSDVYTDGRFTAASLSFITGRLIASDDIRITTRVKIGMLDGGSDARIGKQATILGDVAVAGNLQRHPEANILGNIMTNNDVWVAASLPDPIATSFAPDDLLDDVTIVRGDLDALEPGNYKSLKLKNNTTLTLSAGTYFFNDLKLNRGSTLVTDTHDGAVIINIANEMKSSSRATIEKEGPDQATFTVLGQTKIGSRNNLFANIVNHDRLKIGSRSRLTGFYFSAGDLRLGTKVVVNGLDAPQPTVPEPATLLLLGLGGLGLIRKRMG